MVPRNGWNDKLIVEFRNFYLLISRNFYILGLIWLLMQRKNTITSLAKSKSLFRLPQLRW